MFGAAALLELPKLPKLMAAGRTVMVDTAAGTVVAGTVVAGVVAYASVRFLTRDFRAGRLTPFAIYRPFAAEGPCL